MLEGFTRIVSVQHCTTSLHVYRSQALKLAIVFCVQVDTFDVASEGEESTKLAGSISIVTVEPYRVKASRSPTEYRCICPHSSQPCH